jgi:hypothetical protein
MNYADLESPVQTVKLFPRLAMANYPTIPHRNPRPTESEYRPSSNHADAVKARSQVRARLLRMILENERTRRTPRSNDSDGSRRPNAS